MRVYCWERGCIFTHLSLPSFSLTDQSRDPALRCVFQDLSVRSPLWRRSLLLHQNWVFRFELSPEEVRGSLLREHLLGKERMQLSFMEV